MVSPFRKVVAAQDDIDRRPTPRQPVKGYSPVPGRKSFRRVEAGLALPYTRNRGTLVGAGDRGEVANRGQALERLALELANTLARQPELVSDRLERPRLAFEAEPQLENAPLALWERVECTAHALLAQRLLCLVEWISRLAVSEEVTELALVVGPNRLVEGDGRLRSAERLVDVLDRKTGRRGELPLRRLTPELDFEPARGAAELLLPLDDVNGNAD